MITIPNPIKYDNDLHFRDMITTFMDPKVIANLKFIKHALAILAKDQAEVYIVKRYKNVAICRKGLVPAKTQHMERYSQFFALKNKDGKIISNGKNVRRPESMICVLRGKFRRNQERLTKLKNSIDLTTAERCRLFGYELCKQNTPFE